MKDTVELLREHGYVFKKLNKIDNKILGNRKKIDIYEGVNLKSFFVAIFRPKQKSRFVMKNANDLEELFNTLVLVQKHNIKKKVLLLAPAMCSKSKSFLIENGWKIYDIV